MSQPLQLLIDRIDTPIGEMILVADREGNLRAIDWTDHEDRMLRLLQRHYGASGFALEPAANPHGLSDAFRRYFAGDLAALDRISAKTAGTPFQREVWRALRNIPRGTTLSYAQLAQRIGRPKSTRAVGLANGANPVAILVPCHRVIGASGALTGYGGGLHRKQWLLDHERRD
jgi:methylated-DNA-[protein]-cysteine S-methyltransferase